MQSILGKLVVHIATCTFISLSVICYLYLSFMIHIKKSKTDKVNLK